MLRIIAGTILTTAVASAVAAQSPPTPSRWTNQRGSILEITSVDPEGVITGKFTNNVAGTDCRGTPYDIVGHTLKTGFFFGVTFAACSSIVSWRAVDVTGTSITSSWVLSYIDRVDGIVVTLTDIDTFTRLP